MACLTISFCRTFFFLNKGFQQVLAATSKRKGLSGPDREAWLAAVHGSQKVGPDWATEQQQRWFSSPDQLSPHC